MQHSGHEVPDGEGISEGTAWIAPKDLVLPPEPVAAAPEAVVEKVVKKDRWGRPIKENKPAPAPPTPRSVAAQALAEAKEVEFTLKGVKTLGAVLKRLPGRMQVKHAKGTAWISAKDAVDVPEGT